MPYGSECIVEALSNAACWCAHQSSLPMLSKHSCEDKRMWPFRDAGRTEWAPQVDRNSDTNKSWAALLSLFVLLTTAHNMKTPKVNRLLHEYSCRTIGSSSSSPTSSREEMARKESFCASSALSPKARHTELARAIPQDPTNLHILPFPLEERNDEAPRLPHDLARIVRPSLGLEGPAAIGVAKTRGDRVHRSRWLRHDSDSAAKGYDVASVPNGPVPGLDLPGATPPPPCSASFAENDKTYRYKQKTYKSPSHSICPFGKGGAMNG